MRLLVILLASMVMTGPAFAKSKTAKKAKPQPKFSGKLLTYKQLSQLPKAKRMVYIKGVTNLLVKMESFNNKYLVSQNSSSFKTEQIASVLKLMRWLPEANAQTSNCAAAPKIKPEYDEQARLWKCPTGFTMDYVFQACLSNNDAGLPAHNGNCPACNKSFPHYMPGSTACMPISNFEVLPEAQRERLPTISKNWYELRTGHVTPSEFVRMNRSQQEAVLFKSPAQAAAPASANGTRTTSRTSTSPRRPQLQFPSGSRPESETTTTIHGAPRETQQPLSYTNRSATAPAPATANPQLQFPPGTRTVVESTSTIHGAPRETQRPLSYNSRSAAAPPPQAAEAPQAAPASQEPLCTPPVQACRQLSDADREAAITRFRSTATYEGVDGNICVSGGFAAKYSTPQKRPSTCKIESVIKYEKDGQELVLEDARCERSNQALCNPALLCVGVKMPGSNKLRPVPFCVDKEDRSNVRNPQITARCAQDFAAYLSKQKPVIASTQKMPDGSTISSDLLSSLNGSVEACDPNGDLDIPSASAFRDAWDHMIKNTEALRDVWCKGNGDFAALFCAECEVVTNEIYLLNKNSTGSGCPEQTVAAVEATPSHGTSAEPAVNSTGAIKESDRRLDDR